MSFSIIVVSVGSIWIRLVHWFTNVLEGIGLTEKSLKNRIHWKYYYFLPWTLSSFMLSYFYPLPSCIMMLFLHNRVLDDSGIELDNGLSVLQVFVPVVVSSAAEDSDGWSSRCDRVSRPSWKRSTGAVCHPWCGLLVAYVRQGGQTTQSEKKKELFQDELAEINIQALKHKLLTPNVGYIAPWASFSLCFSFCATL